MLHESLQIISSLLILAGIVLFLIDRNRRMKSGLSYDDSNPTLGIQLARLKAGEIDLYKTSRFPQMISVTFRYAGDDLPLILSPRQRRIAMRGKLDVAVSELEPLYIAYTHCGTFNPWNKTAIGRIPYENYWETDRILRRHSFYVELRRQEPSRPKAA